MKFVIATDGRLGADVARLVDRLAAPTDAIEVLTVVPVPRRLVASMRPRSAASDTPIGHSAGYLGVHASSGADSLARDSSSEDWAGDQEVIDAYVRTEGSERQQDVVVALHELGREPTVLAMKGERVVPAILSHLDDGECGVLIVGQHRGLMPGYLGHTPQRLVSEAPCPVLVVPVG